MARPLRIQFVNACYHVMNRGAGSCKIFKNNRQRRIFLSLLKEISEIYSVEIHAYCLMNNHYHLLVLTPLANLSEAMRHLNSMYTKKFNKDEGRDGPLLRGRYKSIVISGVKYFLQVSAYIHLNPFEAKIVQKPDEFLWSSFNGYFDDSKRERWLVIDKTLNHFKDPDKHLKYKKYVEACAQEKRLKRLNELYEGKTLPVVIASDKAKLLIDNIVNLGLHSEEISGVSRVREKPKFFDIINVVANYYNISNNEIKRKKPRIGNKPRSMLMYLARHKYKYKLTEIAAYCGNISYSAVSVAIARLLLRIKKNKRLQIEIDELKQRLDAAF